MLSTVARSYNYFDVTRRQIAAAMKISRNSGTGKKYHFTYCVYFSCYALLIKSSTGRF